MPRGVKRDRVVAWSDPCLDEIKRVTEIEAIQQAHGMARKLGYRYHSNEEALEDFMTIHLAWFEPRQKEIAEHGAVRPGAVRCA